MAKIYEPNVRGLQELGRAQGIGDACLASAQEGADWANSVDPNGQYKASSASVPTGWNNEIRAGAEVYEGGPGNADERILLRTVEVIEYE